MQAMTERARRNLEQAGHGAQAVEAAWKRGDYGRLCDTDTGETIRPATAAEALDSAEASPQGHITVNGRRCYVDP